MSKIIIAMVMMLSIANANAQITSATKQCFAEASKYHQVDATVLEAIAIKESKNCSAQTNVNTNKSIDRGCMQINSVHLQSLKKYGINETDLYDQCKNIFIGAWQYKKKIIAYGNNWKAVGAYHSESPQLRDKYAREIYQIYRQLILDQQKQPGNLILANESINFNLAN